MGFPVEIEGGSLVQIVEKRPNGILIDAEGNVYERTSNALVFKPTGDQLTLFEPGDSLVLAGTEAPSDASADGLVLAGTDTPSAETAEASEEVITEESEAEASFTQEDAEGVAAQIDAQAETAEEDDLLTAAEELGIELDADELTTASSDELADSA